MEIKELHSVILALLPKEQIVEPDKAQPKIESTTSTYHPPSYEGKEQRLHSGDYKSVPSSSVPPGQRIELLVVDDSRRNRRLMIKTLVIAGFICEEADDGQNAVNMVRQTCSQHPIQLLCSIHSMHHHQISSFLND